VLEAVAIESKRVIDIDEFVPKDEIDELYLNNPYYIRPDGEVGQQASAVIREAIRKEGMVAIGKVVFTSREHIIALEETRPHQPKRIPMVQLTSNALRTGA
jgi:DNA end-binding protein Ku